MEWRKVVVRAKTVEPIGKYILVKPDEGSDRTQAGLYLSKPQNAPQIGTVINTGDQVTMCAVADRVIYKKYETNEIAVDGETYLLIQEESVIGKIVNEKDGK